jgi:hypothetical protein
MDSEEPAAPTRRERWTALGGLLSLVVAIPIALGFFGSAALPWVFVGGGLALTFLTAGVVARLMVARRFPISEFNLDEVSGPAEQIEDAKARLAPGDYAAFAIIADRAPEEPEAIGQIWVHAAKSGGIEMTNIELSYDWSIEPAEQPALAPLLSDDWSISQWEPDEWVLLTHPGDTSAAEVVLQVANALALLFDVQLPTQWKFRAIA